MFLLVLLPFYILIVAGAVIIVLAVFNKSIGIRELYINLLLAIFEWGARQTTADYDEVQPNSLSSLPESSGRVRSPSEASSIISHDKTASIEHKLTDIVNPERKLSTVKVVLDDTFDFITAGVESIIDDQVTSRFKAEQLSSWNLLTRTSARFHHINRTLTLLWFTGFLVRYFILLPLRALLFAVGFAVLIIITHISERITNPKLKKRISEAAMPICMRIICRTFSTVITFHNRENCAKHGGICVANHTSPIDVMILSCDNNYAMVGQRQSGILGFLERTVSKTGDHIWFERTEAGDRKKVVEKLREHVDASKSPIIIFPEGTCINNTSVMMFKKGAFEVCGVVYPIALKYDPRFGDPFWNSSEQSYGEYIFQMMTSWAIICDVWYLPPMHRLENETSIEFAYRVKTAIARRGGLVELEWDGGLKRARVSQKLIKQYQKRYWDWLSRKSCINASSDVDDEESESSQGATSTNVNEGNSLPTADPHSDHKKSTAEVRNDPTTVIRDSKSSELSNDGGTVHRFRLRPSRNVAQNDD